MPTPNQTESSRRSRSRPSLSSPQADCPSLQGGGIGMATPPPPPRSKGSVEGQPKNASTTWLQTPNPTPIRQAVEHISDVCNANIKMHI